MTEVSRREDMPGGAGRICTPRRLATRTDAFAKRYSPDVYSLRRRRIAAHVS